jgi:hypothetical protein
MSFLKLSIAILVSFVSSQCLRADGLNWAKLETSLRNAPGEIFASESLLSVVEGQQADVRTNTGMLVEMAVQSTYPIVAVAGLAGLSQTNPELAYRVSLNHLWNSTNIGFPVLLPFLECLTNNIAPDAFASAFSAVALFEPRDTKSAVIVIQQIPVKHLAGWLFSADRMAGSITVEALVIDRLTNVRKQLPPDQLSGLQTKLQTLRPCPGIPRAIYLLHSDEPSLPLIPSIEALAEDVTVDITLKQMLFKKYAKKLNGLLNVDRIAVSEKERERLKNWLLKYSQ